MRSITPNAHTRKYAARSNMRRHSLGGGSHAEGRQEPNNVPDGLERQPREVVDYKGNCSLESVGHNAEIIRGTTCV